MFDNLGDQILTLVREFCANWLTDFACEGKIC